ADHRAAVEREKDVAKAWLAFALRPRIHAVAESAQAAGRRRNGPHGALCALQYARENLEPGAAENLRDILHDDRIAQIRLVGAIFAQRLGVRNEREFLCHFLTAGKL